MILDNVKPTIQSQKTSIMTHSADVTSDIPANFASLTAKTNMDLNSPDKLVFFPMTSHLDKQNFEG